MYKSVKKLHIIFVLLLLVSACANSSVEESDVFEPDASLQEASDKIKDGYYEEAREILEKIKARDASQKYAVLAKLRIADSYFEEELYEEAVVEYENFLEVHSQHKYSSYAQYKLAMSFFNRIKTADVSFTIAERALKEFEKLQRQYPRNPYMDVTDGRINTCRRVLAEYEFYVGEFYFKKGSFEAAIDRLNDMLVKYPGAQKESEALYYIGLSYENLGQRDNAINAFTTLIDKFPSTEISNEAKKLIASFNE
jgi:outer membrane protein assembly factor BamD